MCKFQILLIFYLSTKVSSKYIEKAIALENPLYFTKLRNIVDRMLSTTLIRNCYAIISDEHHREVLQHSLIFENSTQRFKARYLIEIESAEDLLSPNYETVKTIREIKNHQCDLLLIIMRDGVQVRRLLTFVHEYRALNTRANYVFLYDTRIFTKDLLHIWRKITSVVFLRWHEILEYGKERKWFQIRTVPYPNLLKGTFYSKKITNWLVGRKKILHNLFDDKTQNLKGTELKIAVLQHVPMIIEELTNEKQKFRGVETEIIHSLANIMNFSFNFYQTVDSVTEKWGQILSNGSYSGLIGEIVNMRANIALGDLHHIPHHLDLMDLSIPHSFECLTFLTPESTRDNAWKTLIAPFSGQLWTGVIFSLLSSSLLFYWFSYFRYTLKTRATLKQEDLTEDVRIAAIKMESIVRKDIFDDPLNCVFLTYSMMLLVSLPAMPRNWPVRLLTGWFWVYSILLVVAYRASFTAILANPSPRITIDTLEELSKSNSIIPGAWGKQIKDFFTGALDEDAQNVGAKMEEIFDVDGVVERIAAGKFAYYDNEFYLRYLRQTHGSSQSGKENLHIMKNCVVSMPISIGLEKNSPLKPKIDSYVRRLFEGGLIAKWLKEATVGLEGEEVSPREALMDLSKFWSSFIVLVIGYFTATVAFIVEKLHFKYIVERHPMYDRLNRRAYYRFKKDEKNFKILSEKRKKLSN